MTPEEDHPPGPDPDPLDVWERSVVGKTAQLRFPLLSPVDLRRLAIILRDLANRLDVVEQNRKETPFSLLSRARFEIVAAQAKLTSKPRSRAPQSKSGGPGS